MRRVGKRLLTPLCLATAVMAAVVPTSQMVWAAEDDGDGKVLGCHLHVHSDGCYTEGGVTSCGMTGGDIIVHFHDNACYTKEGQLACTLSEVSAHLHDDSCYDVYETEEDIHVSARAMAASSHVHTASCYQQQEAILICDENDLDGDFEMTHVTKARQASLAGESIAQDTGATHVHTDDCYLQQDPILVCDEEEEVEEETVHVVYARTGAEEEAAEETETVCGQDEIVLHVHDDSCYTNGVLDCDMVEVLSHQHDDECFLEEEEEEVILSDADFAKAKERAKQTIAEAVALYGTDDDDGAAPVVLAETENDSNETARRSEAVMNMAVAEEELSNVKTLTCSVEGTLADGAVAQMTHATIGTILGKVMAAVEFIASCCAQNLPL